MVRRRSSSAHPDAVARVQRQYNLTDEQIHDFREAFLFFDKDGNGSIESSELDVVLKRLGVRMSKKELDDMLSIVDTDGSGTIEFAEFLQMVCTSDTPDIDPEEELYETVFDVNGDGSISAVELKNVLIQIGGSNVTDEQVEAMIAEVDMNGDEEIDFEEFKALMNSTSGVL